MNDFIIFIPTYNDCIALERNLKTCYELGLHCFVVDGRYVDFQQINNSDFSTDDTEKLCEQYGAFYEKINPCREEDKINLAFEKCYNRFNHLLWLSSDEWLDGDVFTFTSNIRKYDEPKVSSLKYIEHGMGSDYGGVQHRFYSNFDEIEHKYIHWMPFIKGTKTRVSYGALIEGLTIHHDDSLRPKERDLLKQK